VDDNVIPIEPHLKRVNKQVNGPCQVVYVWFKPYTGSFPMAEDKAISTFNSNYDLLLTEQMRQGKTHAEAHTELAAQRTQLYEDTGRINWLSDAGEVLTWTQHPT